MEKILKNGLSHAYIVEGNGRDTIPPLFSFLEKGYGVVTRGNPDFWHKELESFGVDDGHALKEMQARKGMDGGRKFFVFSFSSITEEAQNTLLKILEEPTEGTHFFIITPSLAQIFGTVLSRAVVIRREDISYSDPETNVEKRAQEFLNASPAKRLVLIEKLIEEKNREQATLFLNAIEKNLAHNFHQTNNKQEGVLKLKKTALARRDLLTTTPSIKLIFEHLALTL